MLYFCFLSITDTPFHYHNRGDLFLTAILIKSHLMSVKMSLEYWAMQWLKCIPNIDNKVASLLFFQYYHYCDREIVYGIVEILLLCRRERNYLILLLRSWRGVLLKIRLVAGSFSV